MTISVNKDERKLLADVLIHMRDEAEKDLGYVQYWKGKNIPIEQENEYIRAKEIIDSLLNKIKGVERLKMSDLDNCPPSS